MRYRAFVTDYDGTLARGGAVTPMAIEALKALRKSDCFLIMVTGRILTDLQAAFPELELFDAVVAENGAVAYDPACKKRTVLAQPPPPALRARLEAQGVPLEGAGDVIVATREPHERIVLETIRALGLEMQVADAVATIERATGERLRSVTGPSESQALFWQARAPREALPIVPAAPESKKRRHRRKYAHGDLAPTKSFYFRGPHGRLNLRANNLTIFAQIAEGLDEETWRHHLRCGDYATWFRDAIGDDELAEAAQRARREPQKSRELVLAAIREKYTLPA